MPAIYSEWCCPKRLLHRGGLTDIAFLDLGMPVIGGYEIARQMQQHKVLDHTSLVAVTGYGRIEDRAQAKAAGFDAHLLKPVEPELLKLLSAPGRRHDLHLHSTEG